MQLFLNGNIKMTTPAEIALTVRTARRALKLRQAELAAAAGVGVRFLIELEAGKPTAQLGKTLDVLNALGLDCNLVSRSQNTSYAGRA